MLGKVKTVYGDKVWINMAHYEWAKMKGRSLIKLYRKNGMPWEVKGEGQRFIHLDNIAEFCNH